MSDIQKPKIEPGIYRNRKNGKLYFFTGEVGKDLETLEWKTTYHALYDDGEIWYRPTSIFFEEKEPGNPKSTRFELISNLSSRAKNMILLGSNVYEDMSDDSSPTVYTVYSVYEKNGSVWIVLSCPSNRRSIEEVPIMVYFSKYKSTGW
jgi:hypothetical protein